MTTDAAIQSYISLISFSLCDGEKEILTAKIIKKTNILIHDSAIYIELDIL